MDSSAPLWGLSPGQITGKDASEILGSISMAAFLCLLFPQLITNYQRQSADSLSMAFLFVWLLGDVSNLLGGIVNHIAPASLAVSAYLCVSDSTLICQCLYYNHLSRKRVRETATMSQERQPLISTDINDTEGVAPHHASASGIEAFTSSHDGERDVNASIFHWRYSVVCIVLVQLAGVAGWALLYKAGILTNSMYAFTAKADDSKSAIEVFGSVLGYFGALCYLCARVPQIIKNYRGRSCAGLAPLFLFLSILGNLMYGLSVIAYNQEREYLLTSLPWLFGSLGTILEDCVILLQVWMYR
ncbi:putative vacuolar amino acid transporter YPQ3 [Colletotrichum tropicale]|nr:putative vacuolar amino acid transporter YPQ3 [Colletotrichum tropicale]